MVVAAAIGVGVLLGLPWNGSWTLLLFIPAGIHLITMDRWIDRSDSPELITFATLLGMLGVLGLAAAFTGGSASPTLAWVAIVPAVSTLRFRLPVSVALAGVAAIVIVGVAVGSGPARLLHDPVPTICALVMLASIVAVATALMRGELEHRDRAVIDQLTGLLNRTALESRVPELEQQARLTGGSVCLVLCDIDCFKKVNDTHGHERGDAVLKEATYAIRKTLRSFELAYRIGGEELLVVLPGVEVIEGLEVGERLRASVEEARPAGLRLTMSAGVAAAAGEDVRYEVLFRAADDALLRAKREGRNRVVGAGEPPAAAAA